MLILVFCRSAVCAEELSVERRAWNGLSELLAIARTQGSVLTPAQLDATQLEATDSLLIVHPTTPLPIAELAKFLRKGGRLAVADDFGTGRSLFAAFGMGMHPPNRASSRSLRGNPELLIATPLAGHALADGVEALVTNHTQIIYHPDLRPVFALSGSRGAVVLSGAVGKGRLVALADASLLINNMLQFPGNRSFARNLLHFLRTSSTTRLYIAGTNTVWLSGFRHLTTGDPIARIAGALEQLAKPQLPAPAVFALSIVLAAVLLVAAATALPKRSAYARRAYLRTPECIAGMAGRVAYYTGSDRSYLAPLLLLKAELERRLVGRVHASEQPQRDEVVQSLRATGWSEEQLRELSDFMQSVDRLQDGSVASDQRVAGRQFSELVAIGRRILAEL